VSTAPLAAQSAVPAAQSAVDPQTGVVHSRRLLSGVPLGGIGAGKVEILTDGSFAHATVMNNWDRPTDRLPGSFAAIRIRTNTQTTACVLALSSAYGLPVVSNLDFDGLFPQARVTFPDRTLPISVSLLAFSPLVPSFINNSAYPAAAFIFRLKNTLPVPVEVSVALSWEGLTGVGSDGEGHAITDRSGVQAVAIPSADGYFGVRFQAPPAGAERGAEVQQDHRGVTGVNGRGEMALLAYPPHPAVVTTAGWNALDARPGWWDGYSKSGDVSGEVGPGREGTIHPAGVVSARLTLRPNDTVDLPYAVAWYAPHHWLANGQDVGHYYQNLYDDAPQAARLLLDEWPALYALTEEWQKRLTFSNLPRWMARRLINSVAPLTADSVLTRDGRFALTPGVTALPEGVTPAPPDRNAEAEAATREHLAANALLLSFFPQLDAQMLRQCAADVAAYGVAPPLAGQDPGVLLGSPTQEVTFPTFEALVAPSFTPVSSEDLMAAPLDSSSAYVLETAQYAFWTGDLDFVRQMLPSVHTALATLLQCRDSRGIPVFTAVPTPRPGSVTLYLAALRAGQRLAEMADERQLAADWGTAAERAGESLETDYWNGQCYGQPKQTEAARSVCDADQLLGQWMAYQLDLGALLPRERLATALRSLEARAAIGEQRAGVPLPDWDPLAATLGIEILAIRRDQAEAGVTLMHRLEDRRNEIARAPWLSPQRLPDTGATNAAALTSDLGSTADWNLIYAIEGFAYDAANGRMTLRPNLPGTWRTYSGPLFAPTFWGNLEYKPTAHGGLLNLRIDCLFPLDGGRATRQSLFSFVTPALTLRSLRVPGPPLSAGGQPETPRTAYVSVGLRPRGCRTESDAAGNLTLTFDTPLSLSAGDRLQVDIH
jgi:uncharacterized protein (DUF608 family)